MSITSCIAKNPRVARSESAQEGRFEAVLFDLDGTLVDTAPDMVGALQATQASYDIDPLPYEIARQHVSNGAIGLLHAGFPGIEIRIGDTYHTEFLERYAAALCEGSRVFAGVDTLLDRLDEAACPWGVVTNKPAHLTTPLLEALGLAARSACTVSGDTLPVRKPDPGPLLLACDMAGIVSNKTLYIGDASRDIAAGAAAGMRTVAATYGYITDDDDPLCWGADVIAGDTEELAQIVLKAVNLEHT
jgi:2-phosphoglycolate phosphatase